MWLFRQKTVDYPWWVLPHKFSRKLPTLCFPPMVRLGLIQVKILNSLISFCRFPFFLLLAVFLSPLIPSNILKSIPEQRSNGICFYESSELLCSYYMHFKGFSSWMFQLSRHVPNEVEYMVSILVNELARLSQRKIPLIRQKLWFQFVNVFCWFPNGRECASIAEKTSQSDEFYWRKARVSIYNGIVDEKRERENVLY